MKTFKYLRILSDAPHAKAELYIAGLSTLGKEKQCLLTSVTDLQVDGEDGVGA